MTKESTKPTELNTSFRPSWDRTWLSMAEIIARRSQCSKAKVGCVIVDEDQRVLAASYNGPPSGTNYEGPCSNWCSRAISGSSTQDYTNCPSIHAEVNAIARMPDTDKKTTLYVTRMCCYGCAKSIAAAKIDRVVYLVVDIDAHLNNDSVTEDFLRNAGTTLEGWNATT